MEYILITEKDSVKDLVIGGKARNLFRLLEIGMPVPKFIVIPQEVFTSLVPEEILNARYNKMIDFISQIDIPQNTIENITTEFADTKYFAVRSSAIDEDGADFSFAGQFESFLFVTKENLAEKIKMVWCSAFSKRVLEYRKNNNLQQKFGLAVIIQEMVNAESAGVAFGINPINGNTNEKFISSVFGLGEGIVSGELNSDNFIVNNGKITSQLAEKTHKIIPDSETSEGTGKAAVEKEKQNLHLLMINIFLN